MPFAFIDAYFSYIGCAAPLFFNEKNKLFFGAFVQILLNIIGKHFQSSFLVIINLANRVGKIVGKIELQLANMLCFLAIAAITAAVAG